MIPNKLIIKNHIVHHATIDYYPDGQRNITLDLQYYDAKTPIEIHAQIKNWADLELLFCSIWALRKNDRVILKLKLFYLFGQRSDRAFLPGQCNYIIDTILRAIISISSIPRNGIEIFAPHNRYLLESIGITSLLYHTAEIQELKKDAVLIGADSNSGVECHFDKKRKILHSDPGKDITITMSKELRHYLKEGDIFNDPSSPIMIVDDLCDGGGTFIEIAKILKEEFPERELYLFVAHGIFSKGFIELFKYYKKIFTTNSFQDFPQDAKTEYQKSMYISKDILHVIEVI